MKYKIQKKIINNFLQLAIVLAYGTYITQYTIGFGEMVAEGLPWSLLTAFFILKAYKTFQFSDTSGFRMLYLAYIGYLILMTLYKTLSNELNPVIFIFIYQYIPVIVLLAAVGSINTVLDDIDASKLIYVIALCGAISSIVGLLQIAGFSEIIPIDANRARGLSRSTLNFSSLIYLSFIAATQIKENSLRFLFVGLNIIGLLVSQSRSGILAAMVFVFVYQSIYGEKKLYKISITIGCVFILLLIAYALKTDDGPIGYLYDRLYYALDTKNDLGNSLRIVSYQKIFSEFSFLGLGLGSTGPAADRFNSGTGYESMLLAFIAQGGVLSLILVMLLIKFFIKFKKNGAFIGALSGLLFMAAVSQTLENPNVYSLAMLLLLLLVISKKSHD